MVEHYTDNTRQIIPNSLQLGDNGYIDLELTPTRSELQ